MADRISFEGNEEEAKFQQARKGLKLTKKTSSPAKPLPPEEFKKQAEAAVDDLQEANKKAVALNQKFWSTLLDKTLKINKGQISLNLEKELLTNLVEFANVMNNDERQPEGIGSMAMATLLLKSCLYLRDRNNELEFENSQIKKIIDDLEKRLGETENEVERLINK